MTMNRTNRVPLTSRSAKSGIDNSQCAAFLDSGLGCAAPLKKSDRGNATTDSQGFWWCNEHKNRGWLLDYAMQHGFPAIHFSTEDFCHIAIGGNQKDAEMWKMAAPVVKNNVIVAAIAAMLAEFGDEVVA